MEENNNELKKLLQENLKYSKEILSVADKIYKHMMVRQVYFYIKLVLFVGLIIFGIITIGPFIDSINNTIKQYFGAGGTVNQLQDNLKNVQDYSN